MSCLEALFWISAVLVGYTYAGYPLLAWSLSRLVGKPIRRATVLPPVTVLIAAHNEAGCIRETVLNKLSQDYPQSLLDVIVVSDASTDGTDDIVQECGDRVLLIRQDTRAGKTAALNLAVSEARGDVLVFADANSVYARDAIRNLIANFADESVGYVTGRMVYVTPEGSKIGDGCSAYMRYENWLRGLETQLASVIGVDGGIDAVRACLYQPMRPDQLPDFVLPLLVAAKGYRVVYEPTAELRESALTEHANEYRMRVRVSLRGLWALWDLRALMNPLRHGLLALQLISHKLLRYLAFIPLATTLLSSLFLTGEGTFFMLVAFLQIIVYSLAMFGWARGRADLLLIAIPCYFLLLNVAAAHAAFRFAKGERQVLWTPRKG